MTQMSFIHGYALLIGVGADLPITVQDATALRDVLVNPHRAAYPPNQLELLTGTSADRHGILEAFDRLINRTNSDPEATVIVYYSGHGGKVDYSDNTSQYFLVPHDYDPGRPAETAISGAEFTKKIEAIKARKLIVFLDCCHAGGVPALKIPGATFIKSPMPPDLLQMLESGMGRVVVTSSRENEYSYVGHQYSIFTKCLLEALEGNASVHQDGFTRVLDLLIYLFRYVPQQAPGPQHPFVKKVLDLGDNFPLCYYAGGKGVPGLLLNPEVVSLSSGKHHRLKKKLEALENEWDLRSEKVKQMRASLAIEAGVAVRFQLEQQLLGEESKLAELSNEIDQISQTLKM